MEKEVNSYIGDIIASLIKEAAFYKSKCSQYEKELLELKKNSTEQKEYFLGTEDSISSQKL